MSMKHTALFFFMLAIFTIGMQPASYSQGNDGFKCPTWSGYGNWIERDTFQLDLQCQPVFPYTFEIEPDEEITIIIALENYYTANDTDNAEFDLHFAMQRANLSIRQADSMGSEQIVDSEGRIQNVPVRTDDPTLVFILTNEGSRSAIFDFSVRPD